MDKILSGINPQKVLNITKELAKKTPKIYGKYIITQKLDGIYAQIPFDTTQGWGIPLSSNLRQIPAFAWVKDYLNKSVKLPFSCIIIAEAYIPEIPFPILNGLFNRSVGDCACKEVQFFTHDIITFDVRDALTRLSILNKVLDLLFEHNVNIFRKLEPILLSEYSDKLWKVSFEKVVNSGGEGLVCKRIDSPYSFGKRNSDLLKLKAECMVDCLAVRYETTVGDQGNIGFTLVSKRRNGTEIRTVINSHAIQHILQTTPEKIIGKVVTISGMEEFEDGQIRQPIFKYIREDKSSADYE